MSLESSERSKSILAIDVINVIVIGAVDDKERNKPLEKGSEDIADKDLDPLHFLIDFDSIY